MEITNKYFIQATEKAAIDQLCDELESKGFRIRREARLKNRVFDVLAEKETEKIAFEIKAKSLEPQDKESMKEMHSIAKENGYSFRVLIATTPKRNKIVVEGIEQTLYNDFLNSIPDELDELSSHTTIEEVDSVYVDSIIIHSMDNIEIEGHSEVLASLKYDNDEEQSLSYIFPFKFSGYWTFDERGHIKLTDLAMLKFDTSLFDE